MKSIVKLLMAGLVATCCRIATGRTEYVNGVKWSYSNLSNHYAGVTSVDPGKKTVLEIDCPLESLTIAPGNPRYFVEDNYLCDRETGERYTIIDEN